MKRKRAYLQSSGAVESVTDKSSALNCHYLNWWNNTGGVTNSIL